MNYYNYEILINKIAWFIPFKHLRKFLKTFLIDAVKNFYRTEYLINVNNKIKQNDNLVILWVGGGLCGQIRKYILGKYIEKKYNKKVKYDINWYKYNGLDDIKKLNRNFDLLKIFPDLDFEIANDYEINIYKSCFHFSSNPLYQFNDLLLEYKNMYLDGTPYDKNCFYEIKEIIKNKLDFEAYLQDKLDDKNKYILNEIRNCNSVSIHVRRGDFKLYGIVEDNYYINSINEIIKNIKEPKFFIFSDDIDYVKNNIIKKLSSTVLFSIVDINDNDKGYFDLFLMMNCKHQIVSNGSFGYFAYCFNKNKDKILITPENMREYYIENIDKI